MRTTFPIAFLLIVSATFSALAKPVPGVEVEEQLDFPIAEGPFQPTWDSISAQHPGTPEWFNDAKFGVWIHWGPQAAGRSNDWYAKKLYLEEERAAANHRQNFGHPSEFGYKDVLNQWRIPQFNAAQTMQKFRDAGFRYAVIMGVHHDNFDLWNSQHQPWNSVNVGPNRDILGEWARAARQHQLRFGVSFHHEYTWWWWQPAFGSDTRGPKKGVPYDGNLTAADGKGLWWEGLDPRRLYGEPITGYPEYEPIHLIAHGREGIFAKHLPYARRYATQWAQRIQDVVQQHDPDFIYTDGNSPQPFSGRRSGSGYRCDAAQRVVADYFNQSLKRRGKVDTLAIIKFSPPLRGLASTAESRVPDRMEARRAWMGEMAIGGWFYEPGFYYDAGSVIRGLLEFASRDGNFAVSVPLTPEGGFDPGCPEMLASVGDWMRTHGEGIYGSHAWKVGREGTRSLPGGALGRTQAEFKFTAEDIRFTHGKEGAVYVWFLTVPNSGEELRIASMGKSAGHLKSAPTRITMLGSTAQVTWRQTDEALLITCPDTTQRQHVVGFRVE